MPHLPSLTLPEGPTDHPSTSIWEGPSGAGKGATAHQGPALAVPLDERAEENELPRPAWGSLGSRTLWWAFKEDFNWLWGREEKEGWGLGV